MLAGEEGTPQEHEQQQQLQQQVVSWALLVTDRSLVSGPGSAGPPCECLTLVIPPGAEGVGNREPIRGVQLGPSSCTCPPGRQVPRTLCGVAVPPCLDPKHAPQNPTPPNPKVITHES